MQRVCPRIALGADRRTAADAPHRDHHCFATDPARRLSQRDQSRLCLTEAHVNCQLFRAFLEIQPPGGLLVDYVGTRLLVDDEPRRRRFRRPSAIRRRHLATVMLAAALLSLFGVSVANGAFGSMLDRLEGAALTTTSAPPDPSAKDAEGWAAAAPQTLPTQSPMVRPSPSSVPAPTATPAQITPQPALVYVVRPGDTLRAIALAHGTSVEALVAANDLASPNVIVAGQRLEIPQSGG